MQTSFVSIAYFILIKTEQSKKDEIFLFKNILKKLWHVTLYWKKIGSNFFGSSTDKSRIQNKTDCLNFQSFVAYCRHLLAFLLLFF